MGLRRGFKTEANWLSRDVRQSLGLPPESPLSPFALAKHLEIPTYPLGYYLDEHPDQVNYLRSKKGQKDFSAVTLFWGCQAFIIYNDGHSEKRVASDVIHELSHCILNHPSKPPFDESGSRHYDEELEDEANWLGPALLVSEEAALLIASQDVPIPVASDIYLATEEVIRMRLNVTGAYVRKRRRRA
jgi:hypothetical protein